VAGEPFSIAEPVRYFLSTALATFTASRSGAIVYQSHTDQSRLAWIDRSGSEIGSIGLPRGLYYTIRLSPDGRTLLFDRAQPRIGTFDLWTYDFDRGVETRLTSDVGSEFGGVWLPGGRAVVFSADRGGAPHLFRKDLATGGEEEFLPRGAFQQAQDVSLDGATLAFQQEGERAELLTLPVIGARTPSALLKSRFDEQDLRFSPDGRWIAFSSNESGRFEVYVAPLPATGGKTRVSAGGAKLPRWSRDGRELFYLSNDRHLVAVPIRKVPALELGTPVPLFVLNGSAPWIDFDVAADGKRFLAIIPETVGDEQPLSVIVNWIAELNRRPQP